MSVIQESGWQTALNAVLPQKLTSNRVFLVGSTAVNGYGNDYDVVLVISGDDESDIPGGSDETITYIASMLNADGWETIEAEVYRGVESDGWFSARKGDVNLLVSEPHIARLWRTSHNVCFLYRALVGRDTTREERVAFHQAVWGEVVDE